MASFNKNLRAFLAALAFSTMPAFVCAETFTLPATGTQSTTTEPAISGGITGANSVLKNSDGEFYLDKTNNSYTGGTSITAGSIKITNNNSIGTGTINIGASGTLSLGSSSTLDFTRNISGSGTVKLGGTVNWTGNATAFAGTVNMNGKSIVFKNTNASSSAILYQNPDIFCLAANTSAGMITGGGTIRPSNTGTYGGYHVLTLGRDKADENGIFSGQIIDQDKYYQSITKTGSNTWTLSGTNFSYSGPTLVQGGKLVFSNKSASLANSSVTISGGELSNAGTIAKTITMTGGTLTNSGKVPAINVTSGSATIANSGTMGTVTVSSGAKLYSSNGTFDVVLPAGATLYGNAEFILDATHKITGAGTIYAWGARDSQKLAGDLSGFTGTFVIERDRNRGTNLQDAALNVAGTHIVIQKTGSVSTSGDPLLTVNPGATAYVGMISGSLGEIRSANTGVWNQTAVFVVGNDTNYTDHTYSGKIVSHTATNNVTAVTKTGSNTWTLTSADGLTYSGATTINGGTLEFTSTAKLPNSAITLTAGTATVPATLKNAGTISKVVTVKDATNAAISNTGTLTAGVALSGTSTTLTLDGTVALNSSGGTLTTLNVNSGTTTLSATATTKLTNVNVAKAATLSFTDPNALSYVPAIALSGGTLELRNNASANTSFAVPSTITGTGTISHVAKLTTSYPTVTGDLSGFTGTFALNNSSAILNSSKSMASIVFTDPNEFCPVNTQYVGLVTGTSTSAKIRPSGSTTQGYTLLVIGRDAANETGTYAGQIANQNTNLSITKTGSNTWVLTNATGLTYSGTTAINGGTLEFTSTATLPNSQIKLTAGTATVPAILKNAGTITKAVVILDATNAKVNNTGTLTGGVILNGASTTLTLDGTVSLDASSGKGTLTTLNVNSGTTTYYATEKKVTTINVAKGATLTFDKQNGLGNNMQIANIVLNGGTLKSNFDGFANLGPVTLNGGEITDDSTKRTTENYKNYGSFLFYSGVNVTDDAKITAGKFMIRGAGAADGNVGKFTVAQGKTLTVSSQIRLSDSNGTPSSLEKLGAGTMVLTDTAKLTNCASNSTLKVSGGTLAVTSLNAEYSGWTGGIPVVMNGGTLELRNTATNAAAFDVKSKVTGSGTISHVTTTKTYTTFPKITGDLSSFTGTFALNGTSAVLSSSQSMANVVFTNPNEFCPVNTQSIALLTGTSGTIRPSTATSTEGKVATLVVGREGADETGTFAGSIIDFNNNGTQFTQAITKTGSNTWVLTGSNLTYSGPTNVNGGILQLGTESIKTNLTNSAVTVSGTGTLINYGTIAKPVTVNETGILVNYGTIAKAVTVEEGGTYAGMQGSTTTAGVTFNDRAALAFNLDSWTNPLDLRNSTFGLTTIEIFSEEEPKSLCDSFDLFKTDDENILSKLTISSHVEGVTWITSYLDGLVTLTGNDSSGIPEPATWLLLVLGFGLLIWRNPASDASRKPGERGQL